MKLCPKCSNIIKDEQKVICEYCHSFISEPYEVPVEENPIIKYERRMEILSLLKVYLPFGIIYGIMLILNLIIIHSGLIFFSVILFILASVYYWYHDFFVSMQFRYMVKRYDPNNVSGWVHLEIYLLTLVFYVASILLLF